MARPSCLWLRIVLPRLGDAESDQSDSPNETATHWRPGPTSDMLRGSCNAVTLSVHREELAVSEKSASNLGLHALPTLLVALALWGGVWLVDQPLQSKRSSDKELANTFRQPEDIVSAKFWEDPLEVISRHLSKDSGKPGDRSEIFKAHYCKILAKLHEDAAWGQWYLPETSDELTQEVCKAGPSESAGRRGKRKPPTDAELEERLHFYFRELTSLEETQGLNHFRRLLRQKMDPQKEGKILFVGASVPGGGLDELVEARRRFRIGMVSALYRRGYFAKDEGSLSYVLFPTDRNKIRLVTQMSTTLDLKSPLVAIPYETFDLLPGVPSDLPSNYQMVVVLWHCASILGRRWHAGIQLSPLGTDHRGRRRGPIRSGSGA